MTEGSTRGDRQLKVVAVTGGPCGGKSTMFARARQWLEDRGYKVVTLSEVATELIVAGLPPWEEWKDPAAFQRHVLLYGIEREDRYRKLAFELSTWKPVVLLCDRGARDGAAYVDRSSFLLICEECGLTQAGLFARYDAVVHLVTAADGAEGHYTLANNQARTETADEARRLDVRTRNAWLGHPHFFLIDNSTDFEGKVQRALKALARVLNMPEPTEIERKFVLENFRGDFIPSDAVAVEILQTYLTDEGETERRVRCRVLDGVSTYYFTEKAPTGERGKRIEREREVKQSEYEALLGEADPESMPIRKTRHSFAYSGHRIELDMYHEPISGEAIVEVELRDIDETVSFPPDWSLREVTDDKRYKNREIARGSLGR